MITVVNKDCQMSNRLILNAHCLASGICSKQKVEMLTFGDLAINYSCDISDIEVSIKTENELLGKIYRKVRQISHVYRDDKIQHYVEGVLPEQIEDIYNSPQKRHMIHNWYYRDYKALFTVQDKIRSFFSPKSELIENANRLFCKLRKEYDVIVGVHVRRGDYKEWLGGRYYYEIDSYISKINEVYDMLKTMGRVMFVVFSNEQIVMDNSTHEWDSIVSGFSALEDQYMMSLCDYIMGPPSTFSWWAAFMGDKPYYVIDNMNMTVCFNNQICKEVNKATLLNLYDSAYTRMTED